MSLKRFIHRFRKLFLTVGIGFAFPTLSSLGMLVSKQENDLTMTAHWAIIYFALSFLVCFTSSILFFIGEYFERRAIEMIE